jgi:hypothetical protein
VVQQHQEAPSGMVLQEAAGLGEHMTGSSSATWISTTASTVSDGNKDCRLLTEAQLGGCILSSAAAKTC